MSALVASWAPDIASANASAVSPACCGGKPALSSLRASFNVSNGTAPISGIYGAGALMSIPAEPRRFDAAPRRIAGRPLVEHAVLHDVVQVLALAVEQ